MQASANFRLWLVFLDTHDRLAGKTRVPGEGKHSNVAVARLAMEVLLELMALHPNWTVAVGCFYNDQVKTSSIALPLRAFKAGLRLTP